MEVKESGTKSKRVKEKMGFVDELNIGNEWEQSEIRTPKNDLSEFLKNLVYCKLQVQILV